MIVSVNFVNKFDLSPAEKLTSDFHPQWRFSSVERNRAFILAGVSDLLQPDAGLGDPRMG